MKKIAALLACALLLCALARAEDGEPAGYVALTFDDGPAGELTGELLDGLRERDVKVTFFLCGYRASEFPELVRRIAKEGHEVAIHGMSHAYLHNLPAREIQGELEGTASLVEELIRTRPRLFRPPGGLVSDRLLAEAGREGLSVILWSVDPEDWNTRDAGTVVRRVTGKAGDGDIVLMHDLHRSSVRAALEIIDRMKARGYRFCTVSGLAQARGRALEAGEKYYMFPNRE